MAENLSLSGPFDPVEAEDLWFLPVSRLVPDFN
jgi:hypothetical protein